MKNAEKEMYNKDWEKEFPCIKKRSERDVFCVKCSSKFSVAQSGRPDIIQHLKSAKHKEADIAASSSSSQITSFFTKMAFDSS